MWKFYLFGSGGIRCLFLILFRKKEHFRKKSGRKFGSIKNIAYFCGQSWSRRKRTVAMKTQMNERIERYPRIEMWKFQNSTMTNSNTAHAMGLLYPFLYRRKVPIYL